MTVNVLPWPGDVSTSICPSSSSTSRRVTASPSPEPSTAGIRSASRVNSSKSLGRKSSSIPGPVSLTAMVARWEDSHTVRVTLPRSVNLMPLLMRRERIRLRQARSTKASTCGRLDSTCRANPFPRASGPNRSACIVTSSSRSTRSRDNWTVPASRMARSRTESSVPRRR